MHLRYNNVNDSFHGLLRAIHQGRILTDVQTSRVGEVIRIPEPVTISYSDPRKRVLLNKKRDANPFFHLYEALWMLDGRDDVKSLSWYNSQIADIASDDGETFNGAYGARWRKFGRSWGDETDQIRILINHLREKPDSRRAVLDMWNVKDDTLKVGSSKDVCCNLSVVFEIVDGSLNMTVFNRSNDLIWGNLGANYVHFTVLQEYMAASLDIAVGEYHQISSNLHGYTDRWDSEKWLSEYEPTRLCPKCSPNPRNMHDYVEQGTCDECGTDSTYLRQKAYEDVYSDPNFEPFPLVDDIKKFNSELIDVVDLYPGRLVSQPWREPFFEYVVSPMLNAFTYHKQRNYGKALEYIDRVAALDWQAAGKAWILKRKLNWEKKHDPYEAVEERRRQASESGADES